MASMERHVQTTDVGVWRFIVPARSMDHVAPEKRRLIRAEINDLYSHDRLHPVHRLGGNQIKY